MPSRAARTFAGRFESLSRVAECVGEYLHAVLCAAPSQRELLSMGGSQDLALGAFVGAHAVKLGGEGGQRGAVTVGLPPCRFG